MSEISPFTISSVSLNELEEIKVNKNKSEEVRYAARKAAHWLDEHEGEYDVVIYTAEHSEYLSQLGLSDSADNRILACAKGCDVFVTNDLCCRLIAENIFGYHVERRSHIDEIYRGYQTIIGDSQHINDWINSRDDLFTNEYIIIHNTDDDTIKEMRWDGEKFVALKLPPSKFVKGKNSLQRCALDILNNPDISIAAILGGYGSGKSYLTMRMALYSVNEKGWQSKVLGVREIRGEGEQIGYLPGTKEEKIGDFFAPLIQQLEGGEYEFESMKQRGTLEVNAPYFMKGTTYSDTVMLVDEAEDLTDRQIRLIGTRLGNNSRIFFNGDYRQSVINTSDSNALVRMCDGFKGNPRFACIYLGEDVRSEASKMFAELFE